MTLGAAAIVHETQCTPVAPLTKTAALLQVGLYCPKIAIMMEGWATDSKPAQFEVAAQELSAKFLSGVHTNRHSQTGAGPMSLQVLIFACCSVQPHNTALAALP